MAPERDAPPARHVHRGDRGPADDDAPPRRRGAGTRTTGSRSSCRSDVEALRAPGARRRSSPTSCTSSRTSCIGRGLTREARKRGIPIVATNHVMAENVARLHACFPRVVNQVVVKLAWEDAERTFEMTRAVTTPDAQGRGLPRGARSTSTTSSRSAAASTRANYTADLTPRDANRLVFVGRLTTEKQIDVVLRAIAKLDPALDVTLRHRRQRRPAPQPRAARARARPRRPRARSTATPPTRSCARSYTHASVFVDRVDRRAAVDRDDGGDGLGSADRRRRRRRAAAPRARRRERLPVRARQRRRSRRAS